MNTKICRKSGAVVCRSFSTYGKIPTLSAKSTAHGPMSKNRPNKTSARNRCDCDSNTCSTIGSCSGGDFAKLPRSSHTSNAVSCSVKKGEGVNSTCDPPSPSQVPSSPAFNKPGICNKQISTAASQACHIGCWYVGGIAGQETGVQFDARITRSANKKLRKRLATSKSCRNKRWKRGRGNAFHAIVSVTAVKIQFSSPKGVLRLFCCPGI
mmetsp:Transcript_7005/g.26476  ORF Transcript_7005/g.26476 Transcript_7005/m.26476 type:complete len:210 (-) Transcript_7005:1806-2435(-)